ncbi:serine/threonine protein kinase [Pendulispora rubella]|uniref:Serine/threonine protein kinase n=1 Tax=Pendulispora rubella TaxID=2741070 RepID=A0ABZ2L3F8_9BACT
MHDEALPVCPITGRKIAESTAFSSSSSASAPAPAHRGAISNTGGGSDRPGLTGPTGERRSLIERGGRNLLGKRIGGKYIVRSVLGEGGMGTVYEAEHVAIGRAVAVKVLHPSQARKKVSVKRFHHEARAAGAIGHPNICEVYDLGELEDGSPYLVMERLLGETLADRIAREGVLPYDEVLDLITQVLSGLIAAHEKGIVHRDIKPENVFLARRVGCPAIAKILDFGVSKMLPSGDRAEEELHLTRTGMVMGTPFYMSPEQARGDRDLDARVDLYACGVIMYEALTARRPFLAPNYNALLLQILTTSPRPIRELRPNVPDAIERVVEKAMRRSRDDRYRNAVDFQSDLKGLRDDYSGPTRLHPISPELVEAARQSFLRSPTPAASRQVPTPAPARPPPPFQPAVTGPSDEERRLAAQADAFDDMPTEIQRTDFRPRPYDDDDEIAATEVRHDAIEMLRAARTGQRRAAAATPPATEGEDITLKLDNPDDVTEIMREARDRLRGSKTPRR